MNDQSLERLGASRRGKVMTEGEWTAGDDEPADQLLLDRIAQQARRIEALERILSNGGSDGEPCEVVTLKPDLARPAKRIQRPARRQRHALPWWPVARTPADPLAPPPGARCYHLKEAEAKVIAFAVLGLSGEALEREVRRIATHQLKHGDFIPLFITDARDHEVFRRHHYAFEYVSADGEAGRPCGVDAIQPRLEFIEDKWGVDLFINLGLPKGELIRRETRPARERYMLAKTHFLEGRYLQARRLMTGFTEAMVKEASYRFHGKPVRKPKASIIVVSHLDHAGVERGLKSIAAQVRGRNVEVILVDNGNGKLGRYGRRLFGAFGLAEPGFNSGCSAARNLGAHMARGPLLIFLDDDGISEPGCVDALIRCVEETGAVAVRGRVKPLTSPDLTGTHYDLGAARLPALNTTEGVSAWQREAFMAAGGFDPLLAGHEGVELCSRLWRFYGPSGFLYEPDALLLHDYAPSSTASDAKAMRYRANIGYLEFLDSPYKEINSGHHRFLSDPVLGYLALQKPEATPGAPRRSVSILTTARDGLPFLAEYTRSLRLQTQDDFEVIFVDDHSADGTSQEIARLWDGDPRLRLFPNDGRGRGAALNTALRHASGDICIIADVDDLSAPDRVAMTRNVFAANPSLDCMSFIAYNEKNPFRLGGLRTMFVRDVAVRQLFGMPVSFPAFAFLRQAFDLPFSEELQGGIDCDWMHRRSAIAPLRGEVIFHPAVYYREHDGQITARRKSTQLDVRKRAIHDAYARVLGSVDETAAGFIEIFADTRQATAATKTRITKWVASFLAANRQRRVYDPVLLDQAMFESLRDICTVAA